MSRVTFADVCPSIRRNARVFTPADTASDAQVCRKSWGVIFWTLALATAAANHPADDLGRGGTGRRAIEHCNTWSASAGVAGLKNLPVRPRIQGSLASEVKDQRNVQRTLRRKATGPPRVDRQLTQFTGIVPGAVIDFGPSDVDVSVVYLIVAGFGSVLVLRTVGDVDVLFGTACFGF